MNPHDVPITLTMTLPGDAAQVFDFIAAEDVLPCILTGYGLLPAVVGTSGHTGPWTVVGSRRIVHLADGGSVSEQLTGFERPDRFAYRVWNFTHPVIRLLAGSARGEWRFEPDGALATTRVVWTYTFTPRHALARWPVQLIARWLWRGYMRVCLVNSQARLLAAQAQAKKFETISVGNG